MSVDPVENANIKVWLEKVFLAHVHSVFPALKYVTRREARPGHARVG